MGGSPSGMMTELWWYLLWWPLSCGGPSHGGPACGCFSCGGPSPVVASPVEAPLLWWHISWWPLLWWPLLWWPLSWTNPPTGNWNIFELLHWCEWSKGHRWKTFEVTEHQVVQSWGDRWKRHGRHWRSLLYFPSPHALHTSSKIFTAVPFPYFSSHFLFIFYSTFLILSFLFKFFLALCFYFSINPDLVLCTHWAHKQNLCPGGKSWEVKYIVFNLFWKLICQQVNQIFISLYTG